MEIEAAANEMAAAGWPNMELQRSTGVSTIWVARFDNTGYSIHIWGRGSTIMEAILNAKEKADAHG